MSHRPIRTLDVRIRELRGGGFVLCDFDGESETPVQACESRKSMADALFHLAYEFFHEEPVEAPDEAITLPKMMEAKASNVVRPSFFKRMMGGGE